jgi:hypothetical protein
VSALLLPFPKFRAFTTNGAPLAGGQLYSYAAGTSTPLATYNSASGIVPNPNPTFLDATGQADVWLPANIPYKLRLCDANGVQQWVVDNIILGGGDGAGVGLGLITVPFSATPIFDATKAVGFKITLSGNVTSSSFINGLFGPAIIYFRIAQDGTGGRTFVWPANVRGAGVVSPAPSITSIQAFAVDSDGSLDAIGPMYYDYTLGTRPFFGFDLNNSDIAGWDTGKWSGAGA